MSEFAHSGDLNFGLNWWCASTGMCGEASGMGNGLKQPHAITTEHPAHDPVAKPAHYNQGAVECIDAIESALGPEGFAAYLRGTLIAYAWRAGRKGDAVEDLKKGRYHLDREIARREGVPAPGKKLDFSFKESATPRGPAGHES